MKRQPGASGGGRPLFTLSIANWNGGKTVEECLERVLAQPRELFELIVVDNGSTDGSERRVRQILDGARRGGFPGRIQLLTFSGNQGFSAAHNAAFASGRGELFFVLNSDAFLAPDFLESAAGAATRHPEAAMFAVKLYQDGACEKLDNVGLTFCADGQNRGLAHGESDGGKWDEPREVFCPSGAAALYRRQALEKAGTFDEDYFAYGEDFELGLRIRRTGGTCILLPGARAYHKGSSSLGEASPKRLRLIERNRIWTALKHFPARRLLELPGATAERFSAHYRMAKEKRGTAGKFVERHGLPRLVQTVVRADLEALRGAPRMLWKRGELALKFPLSEKTFDDWLERFGVSPKEMGEGV
ncbi:MAG: glycosyltransferase family 2 protein [Bdellovibrionota bacterium]